MRKPQLTIEEKKEILLMLNEDKRSVASVAKQYNRDKKTIRNLKKNAIDGSYCSVSRKTKLSTGEKNALVRMVKEDPSISAVELRKELGLGVSVCTIRRYLNEHGFVCKNTICPKRSLK